MDRSGEFWFYQKGKGGGGEPTYKNSLFKRIFSAVYLTYPDQICLDEFCTRSKLQIFRSSP